MNMLRLFLRCLLPGLCLAAARAEGSAPLVTLQEQPVCTEFLGNGVEWSAYPHGDSDDAEWGYLMTDDKFRRVCERLDFMTPRIVRVMDVAGWRYFKGVDASGTPILDFACDEVRMVCRLLDYCQRRGITVLLGDYGVPGFWGYPGGIDRVDDPRFVAMTTRYLDFLIHEKGFDCIRYYIITNEPNGDWACTDGDWDQWRRGVEMMSASFREAGLSVRVSGPDAVEMASNAASKFVTGREWLEQCVAQLDPQIGCYNVHCYADWAFIRKCRFLRRYTEVADIIRPTGKPMIFGEIGGWYKTGRPGRLYRQRIKEKPFASEDSQLFVYDPVYAIDAADALIQAMKAGWHGASAWMLDDAMHTMDDRGERDQLKVWGFWNSLGGELTGDPSEEEIRPWFCTWSLMCRYFTPGMAIYNPAEDRPERGLRIVVGRSGEGMTVAVLNASDKPRSFRLSCACVGPTRFTVYDFHQHGPSPVDRHSFPAASEQVEAATLFDGSSCITLPGRSFKLFTNLKID